MYLGLVFPEHGVRSDRSKVEAIVKITKSTNKKKLQVFLRDVKHNFLPNILVTGAPLRNLFKRNVVWVCTSEK